MIAIHAKRGVEATLAKILLASGDNRKVVVHWAGETAAVRFTEEDATFLMPEMDDTRDVSRAEFNNLIGYCLHEIGHVKHSTNDPWDKAAIKHGKWAHAIINGLEDPRIEMAIVDSQLAANSRTLFEDLINAVIDKGGAVKPDDFDNIPFMLAVEGRRLNGYQINHPDILSACPWGNLLRIALERAHKCDCTNDIVDVGLWLYNELVKQQPQQQPQQQQQQQDSQQGDQSAQSNHSDHGDQSDQQDSKQTQSDPSDQDDQQDDQQDSSTGGQEQSSDASESPEEPQNSAGKGEYCPEQFRAVEPDLWSNPNPQQSLFDQIPSVEFAGFYEFNFR